MLNLNSWDYNVKSKHPINKTLYVDFVWLDTLYVVPDTFSSILCSNMGNISTPMYI